MATRRMDEAFAGNAILEPQSYLFDERAIARRMVRIEASFRRRDVGSSAPLHRHATGNPRDFRSVSLVAVDQSPDARRSLLYIEDFGFSVQRVTAEQRTVHRDVVETQDCPALTVRLARHANQTLKRQRTDHQWTMPVGCSGIMRIKMQHRSVQRIQRLVSIVLLRQRNARAMAKPLARCEILEIEAVALLVALLADQVIVAEHGVTQCDALSGAA